jgi:hypothetical protein
MLSGELTGLRARTAEDADILHEELYEDVEDWVRNAGSRSAACTGCSWRPSPTTTR